MIEFTADSEDDAYTIPEAEENVSRNVDEEEKENSDIPPVSKQEEETKQQIEDKPTGPKKRNRSPGLVWSYE